MGKKNKRNRYDSMFEDSYDNYGENDDQYEFGSSSSPDSPAAGASEEKERGKSSAKEERDAWSDLYQSLDASEETQGKSANRGTGKSAEDAAKNAADGQTPQEESLQEETILEEGEAPVEELGPEIPPKPSVFASWGGKAVSFGKKAVSFGKKTAGASRTGLGVAKKGAIWTWDKSKVVGVKTKDLCFSTKKRTIISLSSLAALLLVVVLSFLCLGATSGKQVAKSDAPEVGGDGQTSGANSSAEVQPSAGATPASSPSRNVSDTPAAGYPVAETPAAAPQKAESLPGEDSLPGLLSENPPAAADIPAETGASASGSVLSAEGLGETAISNGLGNSEVDAPLGGLSFPSDLTSEEGAATPPGTLGGEATLLEEDGASQIDLGLNDSSLPTDVTSPESPGLPTDLPADLGSADNVTPLDDLAPMSVDSTTPSRDTLEYSVNNSPGMNTDDIIVPENEHSLIPLEGTLAVDEPETPPATTNELPTEPSFGASNGSEASLENSFSPADSAALPSLGDEDVSIPGFVMEDASAESPTDAAPSLSLDNSPLDAASAPSLPPVETDMNNSVASGTPLSVEVGGLGGLGALESTPIADSSLSARNEASSETGDARAKDRGGERLSNDTVYAVTQGDTFWKISEKMYGTGGYHKALAQYNSNIVNNPNILPEGTRLQIPKAEILMSYYPALCPNYPKEGRVPSLEQAGRSAPRTYYVIREGDTLTDIARKQLGNASLWPKIYRLNQDKLQERFELVPGTQIELPPAEDSMAMQPDLWK
ncbi:MAG: LysM peptidoglycan-binding domain-containing protein [Planctomycetia bacterium]|nr:LysM peptidoglycan-binding domain-containing protein [Planctomycetia bacterium]